MEPPFLVQGKRRVCVPATTEPAIFMQCRRRAGTDAEKCPRMEGAVRKAQCRVCVVGLAVPVVRPSCGLVSSPGACWARSALLHWRRWTQYWPKMILSLFRKSGSLPTPHWRPPVLDPPLVRQKGQHRVLPNLYRRAVPRMHRDVLMPAGLAQWPRPRLPPRLPRRLSIPA